MHRRVKVILTIFFMIAVAAIYFLYSILQNNRHPELYPVYSVQPIPMMQEEELHFFPEGLIVCGAPSRFYNLHGEEIPPPLTEDDLAAENHSINIVARTSRHIATANNRIYNTQTIPFTLIYENKEISIWDMKEYDDFLILLIKEGNMAAKPYVLPMDSDFLISFEGMGNANYISADAYGENISLLTVSLDSPVPITRVFHYANLNELYGVLTLENQMLYDIYRMKSKIILIGIEEVLCYNMEGELQWSVLHESGGRFETLSISDGLLIYFPEKAHLDKKEGNALFITEQNYKIELFPKYLSNLIAYENGYLAMEFNESLVFLTEKGKAVRKLTLPEASDWLERNPDSPKNLYVRTKSNLIQLYTSEKQEENNK